MATSLRPIAADDGRVAPPEIGAQTIAPRLTHRRPRDLRPHPAYEPLMCLAVQDRGSAEGDTTPEEPVVITMSGTIIKRHDLWQLALAQGRTDLLCLEHDISN